MAKRTYIVTLVFIVRKLCIYNSRYGNTIRDRLPVDALPAYDALTDACDMFLAIVGTREALS
jgi:hypothetical protein